MEKVLAKHDLSVLLLVGHSLDENYSSFLLECVDRAKDQQRTKCRLNIRKRPNFNKETFFFVLDFWLLGN